MNRSCWAFLWAVVLLAGCASFDFRKEELFEASAKRYGRMIRWSEFEAARGHLAADAPEARAALPRQVRVAAYEVRQIAYAEGKKQVVQMVEISYYRANDLRLKTIQDQQLWEWNGSAEAWVLKSGFPDFQ